METYFDTAMLIGIDLLSGRADHHGRLRRGRWFGMDLRRTIGLIGRNRLELVAVTTPARAAIFLQDLRLLSLMLDSHQQIVVIETRTGVTDQRKNIARR